MPLLALLVTVLVVTIVAAAVLAMGAALFQGLREASSLRSELGLGDRAFEYDSH